jgi:mono/diheme cytochrome c family protein
MVQRAGWIVKLAGSALLLLGCQTVMVEPTLTPVDPRQPLATVPIVVQVEATPAPAEAEPEVIEEDAEPVETPTPPVEDPAATPQTPVVPVQDDPPGAEATPAVAETPAPDQPPAEEEPDPDAPPAENGAELIALGEEVYEAQCATCHQSAGEGTANFPALAGSSVVTDEDPTEVLDVIIHGRGEMPAFGDTLSDEEIAAVTSYIRNAWGNEAPPVSEEEVAEVAEAN